MRPEHELARRQYGLVTRQQALVLGLPASTIDRRIRRGDWEVMHEAVYRLAGVPASWHQSLLALVLWLKGAGVASHRSAARLWLPEKAPTDRLEVTALMDPRHVPAPGGDRDVTVHCTNLLPSSQITVVDGISVTSVDRTLIDLGAVLPPWEAGRVLDEALRRGLTDHARVQGALSRVARRGRRGVGVMRRLLAERDPVAATPESLLESRLTKLIRDAGLPEPARQHRVRLPGRTIARLDLAYPGEMLGIEADGYAFHSAKADWERDRRRDADLTLLGWRILHVTWSDVWDRPTQIAGQIRHLLRMTGAERRPQAKEG